MNMSHLKVGGYEGVKWLLLFYKVNGNIKGKSQTWGPGVILQAFLPGPQNSLYLLCTPNVSTWL